MRKSFQSQKQVCHVWANQSQSEGYANNVFFEGRSIYSYGKHYLAAQIHTLKGKPIALVRSDTYGPATSGHLCEIRNALNGLMPYFYVTEVSLPKSACKELDAKAQSTVTGALRRSKITNKDQIKWQFESIHGAFKDANQLRKLLGKAEKWPTKKQLKEVQAHLDARLARYHELNTPEALVKRAAESAKRKLAAERKLAETNAEKIGRFRRGENVSLYDLRFELLRVKGSEVQTSRGAVVSLMEAKRLYSAIVNGQSVIGARVGHFEVRGIFPLPTNEHESTDKIIEIGCHRILLSEARNIFESNH